MNFALSEEQEILKKSARDFLTGKCPKSLVRDMEQDARGYPPELWDEMANLGWMGLPFPAQYGGADMTFLDLCTLLEEIGRACLPGPFFSTVVLGGLPILDAGNEEQKQRFLPRIAQGKQIVTLALTEPDARFGPGSITVAAAPEKDEYVITGKKFFVPDAHVADYILCVARTKRSAKAEDGVTIFIVDARSPGVRCTPLKTLLGDKNCTIAFEGVRVPKENILGEVDRGWTEVQKIMERAAAAKCCEMAGGAQQVLEMTISYAKERVQFDHPIGSFQAVQHHCANMASDVDGMVLVAHQAAWLVSEGVPCTREVSIAKAWCGDAYRRVTALSHQVHGGIGFTMDYDLHFYTRQAKAAEAVFGDADFHREKVAQETGL